MERFSRPAIVISMHEGEGRGSGRAPIRLIYTARWPAAHST